MRGAVLVILMVAVVVAAACGGDAGSADPPTVEPLAVEAQACDRPQPRIGLATPIDDGLVLTAGHVVEGELRRLEVDGRSGVVVAHDPSLDLAVVAVEHGDDTLAIGTASQGAATIVTADGPQQVSEVRPITLRVDDLDDGEVYERPALRLAIDVAPGDSGAPVVDGSGELIGVVTLRRSSDDGSYATSLGPLPSLLERGRDTARSDAGLADGEACV